jgi:hypothetical protein
VPAMKLNSTQKAIAVVSVIVLLGLGLFPPWRQAAERETAYRKDLGRGFVFRPPAPVAVDCYFVGCKTAPPSYFHVLLYRELLHAQLLSVFGVAVIALWMFRSRRDGTRASLVSRRVRLEFSLLVALLFPPMGQFPLASLLLDIPRQLIHRNELWLIPTLMVLVIFFVCALVVYLVVSTAVWIIGGLSSGPDSPRAVPR